MSDRKRNGGGGGHEGGDERWLLTYADMITLLLVLFIVLFAMSSIDAQKFDEVRRSLSETFTGEVLEESGGVLDGASGVMDPENANQRPDSSVTTHLEQASDATASKFAQEQQKLKALAQQTKFGKDVEISKSTRGIVVRLAGDALFNSGEYTLRPGVRADLIKIERELDAFGYRIEIAGHTDGAPIDGGNYRLGANRALAVVALFEEQRYSGDIRMASEADNSPIVRPKRPQDSVARNRRIEITVLAPGAEDPRSERDKIAASAKAMASAGRPDQIRIRKPGTIRPVASKLHSSVESEIATDLADTSREIG